MRIGVALALVATCLALLWGCSKNDRLYESTPVPQPAASVPSKAKEDAAPQRQAVKPAKARLAAMTEADLALLILEAAAAAREALNEETGVPVDASTEGEKRLHAELVQ